MYPGAHLADVDPASVWTAIETSAELSRLGIYIARVDCVPPRIVYVSPRAAAIAGRPANELIGSLPWSILRESEWPAIQAAVARPAGAPPLAFDVTIAQPSGKLVPIELAATRIVSPGGTFVLGYFRDVSVERETLAALRASEARFRFLVEAAPDGVVILVRGIIVFMNPRAACLLGAETPENAVGKPVASYLPEEDARRTGERIAAMFRTGKEMPPEEYRTLADPNRIVEIKSTLCTWEGQAGVIAFARDVTERKRMQQRLVDADRLAAMGTLAAGVAHEINNPLTYALLGVQRIESLLTDPALPAGTVATIRERLHEIEHGITRVATITQGLRSFARPDDAPPGPVSLGEILASALRMVENDLRHRANVVKNFAAVSAVTGNASRLEQVIINILLNASQALPPEGEHTIEITLAQRGADHVTLSVRDTGRGIPEDIRSKIFDPFFTTRRIGEGMGLGLAVSKTIVEGFGGTIEVVSAPGAGTTMTIVLRAHLAQPLPAEPKVRATTNRVRRRVLIIDDERLVRDAITRLLQTEHEVVSASGGEAGLAALDAGRFDVVICDVMMPGMNGREVHRRVAAQHPGFERRLIFISGGTFTPELDEFLRTTTNRCLSKPFKLDDVFMAIDATCADT
jgi:PAS domain S-box-containing protein